MVEMSRAGRPKASSRETLTEAACELFLERGYEQTAIADIAQRAGVSRSSFFNYFTSKSDLLWGEWDRRLDDALMRLDAVSAPTPELVIAVVRSIIEQWTPDALSMAFRDAVTMGVVDELRLDGAARHSRLALTVGRCARRAGISEARAEVIGAAYATATLHALRLWAWRPGAGVAVEEYFDELIAIAAEVRWK